MLGLSPGHLLLVLLVVVLLFGGGRISGVMGDVAKGIKSFKKGMSEDDDEVAPKAKPAPRVEQIVDQKPVSTTRDEQKADG